MDLQLKAPAKFKVDDLLTEGSFARGAWVVVAGGLLVVVVVAAFVLVFVGSWCAWLKEVARVSCMLHVVCCMGLLPTSRRRHAC